MPPTNTTRNSFSGDPFAELTSPVPDLASTLTARNDSDELEDQDEDDRDFLPARELEALRLLRESTENLDSLSRSLFAEIDEELREANERMSALQREAALLRGAHDTRADERRAELLEEQRLTREHLRSMRDNTSYEGWAPGTTESDVERHPVTPSQIRYLRGQHLREQARDTATRRHRREQELIGSTQSSDRRSNADDGMDWQTSDNEAEDGDSTPGGNFTGSNSLRTAALLQSVWRQARFNLEEEMQSRDPTRQRAAYHQLRRLLTQDQTNRRSQQPSTSDTQRQRRSEERSDPESEASKWVEEAIKHLERLRTCDSQSDSVSSAAAGGFLRGDFFTLRRDDFILDTKIISPPRPTSWLRPGGVFSGSQHASGTSPVASFNLSSSRRSAASPSNEAVSRQSASSQTPLHPLRSSWISNVISRTSAEKTDDSWPVKVTVTSIDYDAMTMTGTMEAFNVPNKNAPVKENSITTYLEGEIIDFNLYTLETKSFNANSAVDSTYWRKLQPFKSLTDSEVVSNLVSRTWLCEELSQKWVLMRWKEKCFVTPSDAQSGLTISGFYYVSIRREDGHIEGLYYDPLSSPYQHLSLMPEKREFPLYTFA